MHKSLYLILLSFLVFNCSDGSHQYNDIKSAAEKYRAYNAITFLADSSQLSDNQQLVFIKDNIDLVGAPNTAGSIALLDNIPSQDAFLVSKMHTSGYAVAGKTNLSEWANFRSFNSISGWSSVAGQTLHFMGDNYNPCGSSSGSAVVVALKIVKAAIGTETNGSISCPASVNGIVGIKPTVGLVSRTGIIPISPTQDTAGPMAINVTEAAKLLSAISGPDPKDPQTLTRPENFQDNFLPDLVNLPLYGKKFGLLPSGENDTEALRLLERIQTLISQQGGTIIKIEQPSYPGDEELVILLYEFKHALEAYLSSSNASIKSLKALMEFNQLNADLVMPYFDQSIFEASLKAAEDSETYDSSLAIALESATNFINSAIDDNELVALIGLTRGPAWKIDSVKGDDGALQDYPAWGNGGFSAIAGTPHITIPFGEAYGLPIGLSLMGKAWSDHELVQLAFTLESILAKSN